MDLTAIITSVLSLIAGMGVFLIACSMMSANLEALGSSKLKALFAKAAGSRLLGVGVGAAATAVIQSSSATSVMAIGFVNAGIMTLPQAAAVIFGANVGTTITGQLIALGLLGGGVPLSVIFAASAGVGAVLLTFAGTDRLQRTGGILAGFGMLFAGLDAMSTAMGTFAELEAVRLFLARFQAPLLLAAVGTVLTAVIQSSSAMTSMAIAMVAAGLISLDQGIYITMGANIGTCVTALLAGAAGTENARRTALIHLIFNVGGAAVFLLASLPLGLAGWSYGALLGRLLPRTPQVQLAMFHTVFNVTTVLLVLPLTDRLTALVCRLVPGQEVQETGPRLLFVNAHMLKTPPIAVQQVKNEILHMGDVAMENFRLSCARICSLEDEDKDLFQRNEEQLNYLNRELTGFIVQLLKADLSQQDRVYLSTAFRSVADFERIGDYAENIMEYADKLQAAGGRFSQRATGEIGDLQREVEALYEQGMTAYREGDRKALRAAFQIEDGIDRITEQMGENHIQRLSEGVCTPSVGAQYLSLSANVERIADHIINVAKTINA